MVIGGGQETVPISCVRLPVAIYHHHHHHLFVKLSTPRGCYGFVSYIGKQTCIKQLTYTRLKTLINMHTFTSAFVLVAIVWNAYGTVRTYSFPLLWWGRCSKAKQLGIGSNGGRLPVPVTIYQ